MARYYVASIDTLPRAILPRSATRNARVFGDGKGNFWLREDSGTDGFVVESDLAATTTGFGASLVGIEDAATIFTATTVEGALAELRVIADANAAVKIQKKEATIGFAQIAALGAVTSGVINVSTALPANAHFVGAEINVATKVQNVGDTDTTTADLGTTTVGHEDWGVDGASLKSTGKKGGGTNVAYGGASLGTEQVAVTVASDVNLDTITAGSFTCTLWYFVLA